MIRILIKRLFHSLILVFAICLITVLFDGPAFAQLKDLVINAERISYEKEKYRIEAEGSIEVNYKDVTLFGNHLICNTSAETLFVDRGFSLYFEGITIEGSTINYALNKKRGEASKVRFRFQNINLDGEKIRFDVDRFVMNNAGFTTCDLTDPHYRVTASEINLYPKYGWLVAYWGLFWLGKFPLLPLPTYIYDFRAEERAHKNLPPFPEVGTNPEDGLYFRERLAWHLRPGFSGTYGLGWASNKGLLLGIDADYYLNDQNRGELRLDWNSVNRLVGGLTHRFFFGQEVKIAKGLPIEMFAMPRLWQYQLETTFSYHERINYQRVSYYPKLDLSSVNNELIKDGPKLDFELQAAMVAEEGNTRLAEGRGAFKVYQDFLDTRFGKITPSLNFDGVYFSNGAKWLKPCLGIGLEKLFENRFLLKAGYLHYFLIEGQSPFNFEMYRFRAADRLSSEFSFMVGETGVGVSTSYYLDNWSPEDVDYSLFFKLHCYNLSVTYRSLRQEFAMGFSLAQ